MLLQEEEIIPAESLPVKQQQLLLGEADVASRQQVNEYEVATSRQVFFIVTFFIVTFYYIVTFLLQAGERVRGREQQAGEGVQGGGGDGGPELPHPGVP